MLRAVSGHRFSEHLGLVVTIGHPFVYGRLPVEGWLCTLGLAWENIASAIFDLQWGSRGSRHTYSMELGVVC